jgi:hypothetical protein
MSILARSNSRPVGEFPGAHEVKQIEILGDGAVAEPAVAAGLGQHAAIGAGVGYAKARRVRQASNLQRRGGRCWASEL